MRNKEVEIEAKELQSQLRIAEKIVRVGEAKQIRIAEKFVM